MEKLNELLSLDPAALLPDLPALLEKLPQACRWAVLVAPAVLVALGLSYLLFPPKEATYEAGWRCWWGMGSVEVWRFTQKLAGLVWTGMGLVMGAVMLAITGGYAEMETGLLLMQAVKALVWQIGLVAASILGINVTLVVLFDRNGVRRAKKKTEV